LNSFSSNDIGWTVRYGRDSHFDGLTWDEMFGDEYNWTSAVPHALGALGNPAARLNLQSISGDKGIFVEASWWSVPIHLMAYGLGWTHLGIGLRRWRLSGYPVHNDILRFIHNTYGSSIEALELWLNSGNAAPFADALAADDKATFDTENSMMPNREELAEQQRKLLATVNSGPRHKAMQKLVEAYQSDPLHLHHALGSIKGWWDVPEIDTPPLQTQVVNRELEYCTFMRYGGLIQALTKQFRAVIT
jgi:hypothetical protein